ncbi:IS110 family transposase [Polaribacter litorisediminis]|uniref:IS110 family transposase n=1 Tax=Polaribacter litorisediminis TaxID=1908341 RepID=UPI001CBAC2A4|nr:IS110 family transposase [Polaribacter litorisediminis]UAM99119.1 IS110 family transposase [Polaribacter litorisediminis]
MEQQISLDVVNKNAAGIDIGSRSHWVAVGQSDDLIKEFGVYNENLYELAHWLKQHNIESVAMESTGNYWQNLHAVLISKGFEVTLCNGKFTKNIKGKKTDVKDSQWIQKLHSLGLLSGSFLPDEDTEILRIFTRHRYNLIKQAASATKKMQKYLRLMNIRLDVVVKDVVGLTGLKIIRAIAQGETIPEKLASLRHYNCKKSEEEIAKALHSNGRKDFLYALKDELDTYEFVQKKIRECDHQIASKLDEIIGKDPEKQEHHIDKKPYKRINKNTPKDIDINLKSYKMFKGTDLLAIEGMSYNKVLTIMSEVGYDGIKKFKTAKHFTSWLRLAPNNKVSGGKVLSSKIGKGSSRLKIALRNAANAIGNLKDSTPLGDFFQRINFRKGRVSAITATARKLAVIIWNMVVKGVPYENPEGYLYLDQKRKLGLVKRIRKQIDKFGLTNDDLQITINQ